MIPVTHSQLFKPPAPVPPAPAAVPVTQPKVEVDENGNHTATSQSESETKPPATDASYSISVVSDYYQKAFNFPANPVTAEGYPYAITTTAAAPPTTSAATSAETAPDPRLPYSHPQYSISAFRSPWTSFGSDLAYGAVI